MGLLFQGFKDEIEELKEENATLRATLALTRDEIRRCAQDTLWAGDHETVVEAINYVLGVTDSDEATEVARVLDVHAWAVRIYRAALRPRGASGVDDLGAVLDAAPASVKHDAETAP